MSVAFGNGRRNRTRSRSNDRCYTGILAKVGKSKLKALQVAVTRNKSNHIEGGPQLPLERSIDDPARICDYVHYRRDENKRLQPPIFGRGIKVNQDFTEIRGIITHDKTDTSRKTRSKSKNRSRSPRNRSGSRIDRSSSPINRSRRSRRRTISPRDRAPINRSRRSRRRTISPRDRTRSPRNRARRQNRRGASQEKWRNERKRSRSIRKKSSGRWDSSSRSVSRERKYSSERRRYKDDSHRSRRSRHSRSSSRSVSPHEHEPNCPLYVIKKFLTPLQPGEYIPGHPDLALRTKSRSNDDKSRSDNVPSPSTAGESPDRDPGSSKTSGPYQSVSRDDHHLNSRSDNVPSPSTAGESPDRDPGSSKTSGPYQRVSRDDHLNSRSPIQVKTVTTNMGGDDESGKVVISEANNPNAENEVEDVNAEETGKDLGREAGSEANG